MILIVQVNDSVQGNLWQNLNFLSFLPGIILQGVCTIPGIFSTLLYFRVSHDTRYFLDTRILQSALDNRYFLDNRILQGVPRYQVFSRHSYTSECPTIPGIFSTLLYFRVSHGTRYFIDTRILQGAPRYQVFSRHSCTSGCPTVPCIFSTLLYFRVSHDTRYFIDTHILQGVSLNNTIKKRLEGRLLPLE